MTIRQRLLLAVCVVLLYAPALATAQDLPKGTGLEVAHYEIVQVVVDGLAVDEVQLGLTNHRINTHVAERLTQAGLRLGPRAQGEFLAIHLDVVGHAFGIQLAFVRRVSYDLAPGQRRALMGRTWADGGIGTHRRNAAYILGVLDQLLDSFLTAYLKANHEGRP